MDALNLDYTCRHNDEKNFLVWINEEDHVRCISMQKGGNMRAVFERFGRGISEVRPVVGNEGDRGSVVVRAGGSWGGISEVWVRVAGHGLTEGVQPGCVERNPSTLILASFSWA